MKGEEYGYGGWTRKGEIDIDELLTEATLLRKKSNEGQSKAADATTMALETLNNFSRALLSSMDNNQPVQDPDGEREDTAADTDEERNESSDCVVAKEPVASEAEAEPSAPTVIKNEEIKNMKKQTADQTNHSAPTTCDYTQNKCEAAGDMLKTLQTKIHFPVTFTDDDIIMKQNIRMVKHAVSCFRTYDDMIAHINAYIDAGNAIDAEIFFLLHSVYTLQNPEKYYLCYRQHLFSKNRFEAGKGKEIQRFLMSI